jgi:mRNA-degrading endonuclease RelE of RelBE toxin-antitoxin system
MTVYRIAFTREVRRQIGDLPGHIKTLAKQEIAGLSDNPRPPHCKELVGHPTYFRLWLGRDYRLVWRVVEDERMVEIEYVGYKTPTLYARLGLTRPQAE